MFKIFVSLIISICLLSVAFAGTTGKISGLVTDKNNGEPLVGVNITIEGTFLGASTDIDGYYTILNVPAGNYSVVVNYVGYATVTYQNIRVVPDITKRVDVELQEATIELGEEIIVVADRPFFEQGATNTVRVLDSEEIRRVPVKGVNQVVAINAGVVMADGSGGDTDNAELNVRGGRGNETLFIVDGVPMNDLFFGNAAGTIPDAAIEQVSSQLGGFSAKYGSAQSGVINIVTKGGSPKYFGSFEGVSSEVTDAFGYNQITATFGGPVIPDYKKLDFFTSFEYINTDDSNARASGLIIPSADIDQDNLLDNEGESIRFTAKVNGYFGDLKATLSGNGSFRKDRNYIHSYAKANSFHNPKQHEDVLGASLKLSNVFDESSFIDVIIRARDHKYEQGDGFWFDDIFAYGDSAANAAAGYNIPADGQRIAKDDNGVFYSPGRVSNSYYKYNIQTIGADVNFTKQFKNHLLEIGGSAEQSLVRYYWLGPVALSLNKDNSISQRYFTALRSMYGYDLYGSALSEDKGFMDVGNPGDDPDPFEVAGPKKPITFGVYVQDKVEFDDFILNFGLRWDYFDPNTTRIKDINKVLGDDGKLTVDDYEDSPVESYISPRIGFAYPVSEFTVFHAQYGIFRQRPRYFDLYDSWVNLDDLEGLDGQGQNLGHLEMESTTQYEFGFKQQIGNVASLDITAYYKNIRGLTNDMLQPYAFGATTNTVITRANADFGTVKGFAFNFNLRRIGPVSLKLDYTLALSEGTGSSSSSAFTAAFRNTDGRTPLAIAPLEFDQTHTLTANVDLRALEDEGPTIGGLKILENTGLNILMSYSSGRPYTPVEFANALSSATNYGTLTQYVNSATTPGNFRVDLKLDKRIYAGSVGIVPYLWIQNLFDNDNIVDVWPSTGEPDNTAFLNTPQGQQEIQANGEGFIEDYKAFERDPENYGLPRLIRVGLRLEF